MLINCDKASSNIIANGTLLSFGVSVTKRSDQTVTDLLVRQRFREKRLRTSP